MNFYPGDGGNGGSGGSGGYNNTNNYPGYSNDTSQNQYPSFYDNNSNVGPNYNNNAYDYNNGSQNNMFGGQQQNQPWPAPPTPPNHAAPYPPNNYNQSSVPTPPSSSSGNQYPGGIAASPPSSAGGPPPPQSSTFNWYPGSNTNNTTNNYQPFNTRVQPRQRATSWHNPLGRYGNYVHQIPQGYEVKHTNKGMPYLVKQKDEKTEDDEDWEPPKFFSGTKHIRDAYGLGVWLYFDFVKNFIVVNFVFFLLQLINFINFVIVAPEEFNTLSLDPRVYGSLFYSSAYPASLLAIWRTTNALCIVVALLFPAFYWFRVRRIYNKLNEVDTEEEMDFGDADIIEDNKDFSSRDRGWRFVTSYSSFLSLLVLQVGLVSLLILGQNSIDYVFVPSSGSSKDINYYISSKPVTYAISFAISVVTAGLNMLWAWLCNILTNYERHKTYTSFRKHHTVKLVSFKLLNVFFMSTVRGIFTRGCPLEIFGQQFLIQMFTDIVVFNGIEMLVPVCKLQWKKWRNGSVEEEDKPEFDTADEYLEVLYRQHVLYMALPAFPMMSLLVFLASILELYLDKLRLIKVCQRPPRTQGSIKTFLALFLFIAAILALGNPGAGTIYLLVGRYWCVRGDDDLACVEQPNRVCAMMQNNPTFTEISI